MVNRALIPPMDTSGPLHGLTIIEFVAKGPAPLFGMLLGDMGADVIRVDRPLIESETSTTEYSFTILGRNRRSIDLDLKRLDRAHLAVCDTAPPTLGADSAEILREPGLTEQEGADFVDRGSASRSIHTTTTET